MKRVIITILKSVVIAFMALLVMCAAFYAVFKVFPGGEDFNILRILGMGAGLLYYLKAMKTHSRKDDGGSME